MSLEASLFESQRQTVADAIADTIVSLQAYADRYRHWAIAFSGGKDSTAVVTLVAHLIETGQIRRPESLTVLYADTRLELLPLQVHALSILAELRDRDINTQVVLPALDDRFFVYMLGRGIPPPNNKTFRWCTSQIKIEPMWAALKELRDRVGEKLLMLTGVRLGESAQRDARIQLSCSRDNSECGQGWLQVTTPEAIADTLAPCLHWRVCNIWAWLVAQTHLHGFDTRGIGAAYGGDEKEEIHARTGCTGCPLASKDVALDALCKQPGWEYLAPLKLLREIFTTLRFTNAFRLRQPGFERRKDGSISSNPQRKGPLTFEARMLGLGAVLGVQEKVNRAARQLGRPEIDLLNAQEHDRILELIRLNTWPDKWTGDEPTADVPLDRVFRDGTIQPLMEAFRAE